MYETRDTALDFSYKVNPAGWSTLKNALDVSSAWPACVDCVEQSYPSSEITSQCTDKCVVIACDDPGHSDISCHGARGDPHCDLICDGTMNCTNCTGFDEFLQCCTDYHSYLSVPQAAEAQSAPIPWDSSLDTFLCACGEQGQDSVGRTYGPPASTEAEMNYIPATNNTSHTPSSLPFVPVQTLGLSCMWGNCQARFASLSDLVGHVNLEHLRVPPSPSPVPALPIQSDSSPLSCLWRNCTAYSTPESIPTFSSGNEADGLLSVLADHLLHDHLGPAYDPHLSSTASGDDPPACSSSRTNSDQQNWNKISPPLVADHDTSSLSHQCSGTHKCYWKSCEQSFATCSDLTSHITSAHVGGGKAHYECFWEGCNRNGGNGFSSKQKISRHLQSHTGHRPYQCEICLQNFSEAATLQQHMRRHTQEKPYKCDYPGCGKSFAITGALTIHKRMHNGHKPFKCKYCDRAFAESSNLSKHLRTHTGARPYSCTEPGCNKSFARPDQLSRHKGVHRKGISVNERME